MSLVFNGTTIKKVIMNGTEMKKVVCNGTEVFNAWDGYAYNNGDQCVAVTGGWSKTSGTGSFNLNSNNMQVYDEGGMYNIAACANSIDFTGFSRIRITGYFEYLGQAPGKGQICLSSSRTGSENVLYTQNSGSLNQAMNFDQLIDVSGYSLPKYITLVASSASSNTTYSRLTITRLQFIE